MGGGGSVHYHLKDELDKPFDAADCQSLDDAKAEISRLRLKIVENIPLIFSTKVIITLHAPPEFPIMQHCRFLSKKVCLPLINVNDLLPDDLIETRNLHGNQQHQLQRQDSASKEDDMIAVFTQRLMNEDCDNGCVIVQYPSTVKQVMHLKSFKPDFEIIPIFYELDSETMRLLQWKWDRWIHPASGRAYHLVTSPPKRMVESGNTLNFPSPEFMVDDETGEPLVQLEEDSLGYYKKRLEKYRAQELPLCTHFETTFLRVKGCSSMKETNREVTRLLCRLLAEQPVEGTRPNFSVRQSMSNSAVFAATLRRIHNDVERMASVKTFPKHKREKADIGSDGHIGSDNIAAGRISDHHAVGEREGGLGNAFS